MEIYYHKVVKYPSGFWRVLACATGNNSYWTTRAMPSTSNLDDDTIVIYGITLAKQEAEELFPKFVKAKWTYVDIE